MLVTPIGVKVCMTVEPCLDISVLVTPIGVKVCMTVEPCLDIWVLVTPIGVKVCVMVEPCPATSFSRFGGDIFRGLKMQGQKGLRVGYFGLSDTDSNH